MTKACVIGWPIEHSLSPVIHGYWLKLHGIAGSYEKRPVRPEELREFLAGLREMGLAGCNVTLPHKEAAARLVEIADPISAALGSINTVYLEDGCLKGMSTDGEGFRSHLMDSFPDWDTAHSRIVILGAGGAARAIAGSLLAEKPAELVIANRTLKRAGAIAEQFGGNVRAIPWQQLDSRLAACDLLINTTSLGMRGQPSLEISLATIKRTAIIADIVYNPLETGLLQQAKTLNLQTLDGLGMLLHQAVPGFEKWFGKKPAVTEDLRGVVLDALHAFESNRE